MPTPPKKLAPFHALNMGALIIGVLRNGLNLLDVSAYWQTVVIGAVIVIAVWVDVLRQRAARS